MNQSMRRAAPAVSSRLRIRAIVAGALLAALGLAGPVAAQITRGAISGTVRDASGAVVPGASVTATNPATNSSRTAITDAQGFYRIPALEPASYTVRAELSGFQTVDTRDVDLKTATEVTLNVELKVAGIGEAITVTVKAEAIALNKTNPTVGLTTTQRQVAELPIPGGRNINNLVLLTPNAASSGGQGTYAVNGQRSRNNNYMIDGSDNNDISVTIATTAVVPESVQEFQVLTNPYSVEFGRNSGAQINVITRSGSNTFRGEAWDYFRTSKLAALTNIEKDSGLLEPAKATRHQAGASLGGPIIKDRTFFFALFQYDAQRGDPAPGGTVRMPTPAGFATLQNLPLGPGQTAASRQAVLQQIQFLQDIYGQNPNFRNVSNTLVNGVPVQTGQANINIKQPSTYKTFNGRIDHRIGDNDNASIRAYYVKRLDQDQVSNCNLGTRFCGSQDLSDTNIAATETHTFGSSTVNEFRFSLVRRNLDFPENDPTSPTATLTGLFTIGGASNFPQSRITDSYQFSDSVTWLKGKHAFKFGADIRYNKVDNNAAFDSKGTFQFNSLQDYINNNAAFFQQALQTSSWKATQWQNFFYVQDDFRVSPDLTLNLGLRYEISTVPLGMLGATDAQSLAALVPGPVKQDKNNFEPRLGFAWSPRSSNSLLGNGKTVFRGGFGISHDVLFYNLLTVNASNFPRVVVPRLTNVQNLYPNLLPVSGTATFNPQAQWVNSAENTQNPETRFWSFSIGREISDFVFEVGYTGAKSYHGINQIDVNPGVLTPAQAALVASTRNPNAIPAVQLRRVHPEFGSRLLIPGEVGPAGNDVQARSSYNAVYIQASKRMNHGLQFGGSYTYSKSMSNNDASLGEGGTGQTSQRPQSMFNYEVEWSRSYFDRPHRFVVNYIWEIPGFKSGPLKYVLGGWQISGVTQTQSGVPFTIFTGVDSNGDGSSGGDRPNVNPNGSFTWDKDHKNFTNNGYYTAPLGTNNLPLQNGLGDGNAPRNSERAASYWITDLTVLKRFEIGKRQIIIRGDAFNAFNQDNYGAPIASMSNVSFGNNTNDWGHRIIEVSAKLIW